MSKPDLCEKHGVQPFDVTSPRLALAILQNESFQKSQMCVLRVESSEGIGERFVDVEFARSFGLEPENNVIALKGRNKGAVTQHPDFPLVRKIFCELKYVCPICLAQLIERAT